MTDKGKSAAAMKSADSMADTLATKERAIIDSITKKDQKAFLSLVSSDGVLSGPRGARRVGDLLTNIFDPDYTLNSATVEDPKVMMIDKDAAVLTYKSTGTETYKGKSETSTAYAVTVWARRGDTWMAVFHQESMVTPADAAQ
jgi:hypothetical protein